MTAGVADHVPGLIAKQDITSASTMAVLLLLLADDGQEQEQNGREPDDPEQRDPAISEASVQPHACLSSDKRCATDLR